MDFISRQSCRLQVKYAQWRSLYTGHVDVRMISKLEARYRILSHGQDFHYLPADILLIQKIQKGNSRKKKKKPSVILFV